MLIYQSSIRFRAYAPVPVLARLLKIQAEPAWRLIFPGPQSRPTWDFQNRHISTTQGRVSAADATDL